jgi:hypothetical protein
VFRRTKDLIDVYALSHCVSVKTADIHSIWERESRIIGTFDAFCNRQDELRHAYDKLRRIDVKPEFDTIYNCLFKFLQPFIEKDTSHKIWNKNLTWDDDTKAKKPSLLNKIQKLKDEIALTESERNTPKKHNNQAID